MRFTDYLIKENDQMQQQAQELKQAAQAIVNDCKPYLQSFESTHQIMPHSLYRGMHVNEIYMKKDVRKNRKPSDMQEHRHQIIDKWFKQQFGVAARSEGLFVTTAKKQAARYGVPYYIFPIGQYSIIASTEVRDLFDYIRRGMIANGGHSKDGSQKQAIYKTLEQANYQQYSSPQQIHSDQQGHEATIITDSYYAVNASLEPHVVDYFFEQLENVASDATRGKRR